MVFFSCDALRAVKYAIAKHASKLFKEAVFRRNSGVIQAREKLLIQKYKGGVRVKFSLQSSETLVRDT